MPGRIVNLVTVANDVLRRLSAPSPDVEDLSRRIRRHVARVEELLFRGGMSVWDLPGPSRRAYGWLRYLADPDALRTHVSALERMAQAWVGVTQAKTGAAHPGVGGPGLLKIAFFHTAALWRARSGPDGSVTLTASEAFVTAPPEVFDALAELVFASTRARRRARVGGGGRGSARAGGRGRAGPGGRGSAVGDQFAAVSARAIVRQYAASPAFVAILRALEPGRPDVADVPAGRHYDLGEVFERVNVAYFEGRLDRPVLTWSHVLTRRKLGHYQPGTDTVMLSLTLDSPSVPAYVVDFIMYHELLHRTLGVKVVNGRQRAHTAAFRRAEKRFPKYAEAQEIMKRISRGQGKPRTGARRR